MGFSASDVVSAQARAEVIITKNGESCVWARNETQLRPRARTAFERTPVFAAPPDFPVRFRPGGGVKLPIYLRSTACQSREDFCNRRMSVL